MGEVTDKPLNSYSDDELQKELQRRAEEKIKMAPAGSVAKWAKLVNAVYWSGLD